MTAQQYTGEAVSLLSHLIATPSVSRDERRAADIMEEELAREASVKLAEATGADCVQVIGSKFVLYLQKKKDSAYADLLK